MSAPKYGAVKLTLSNREQMGSVLAGDPSPGGVGKRNKATNQRKAGEPRELRAWLEIKGMMGPPCYGPEGEPRKA